MSLKSYLKRSAVGRIALIPYRFVYASRYFAKPWCRVFPWLIRSRELANFTYELTDRNKEALAFFVSAILGTRTDELRRYVQELEQDHALKDHIRTKTIEGPERYSSDSDGKPGKRYLYYVLVRSLKPKLVFEAGTEKGFGSCVMSAALARNASEGQPGRLVCIDMSAEAGYLFVSPYSDGMEKKTGDSVQVLSEIVDQIDLFIHDTTTLVSHERAQFAALEQKLSPKGLVCSAWLTAELLAFAERTDRSCLVFRDEPKDHWYPGGSLSVVFPVRSC